MSTPPPRNNTAQNNLVNCDFPRPAAASVQVIDGLDVLDVMEKAPVGKKERPVTDILVKDITIHANPIAENG